MHSLAQVFFGVIALVSSFFGGVQHFGSVTLTSLSGSDHQNTFPTTYNANNTALNNGKIDVGSTSIAAITTLSNLVTVGALTSGSIGSGFTAINVGQGGTGSTTLSSNQILLGNGTSLVKTVSGWGTSGQLLTSGGAGAVPIWASASFDTTQNYNFTGTNLFKNLNASSTAANPIVLNGLSYWTPASHAASSTVLAENGSGSLSFNTLQQLGGPQLLEATTTDLTVTNNTFENIYATNTARTLIGNQFKTTNQLSVKVYISSLTGQSANSQLTLRVKLGGTTVCTLSNSSDLTVSNVAPMVVTFTLNATSTAAEMCRATTDAGIATVYRLYSETFSTVDLTVDNQVSLTAQWNGNTGNSLTIVGADFMKY